MNKSSLGVHKIELVVNAREHFSNRSGITNHATCSHNLRQVTPWNDCGGLVVDSTLESCWAPVHKLNGPFCFDCSHSCIHILWHNIAPIHHAACHVLSMAGIALHIHGSRLENRHCDLCHRQLLMI